MFFDIGDILSFDGGNKSADARNPYLYTRIQAMLGGYV